MSLTKTAKEYAAPRIETAVEYATPKVEAAVEYASPKLDAAREAAVARAADAMERLTPHAEALRDRLVERAAASTSEAGKRGRRARAALRGEQPGKKRMVLWSALGLVGGLGAGLAVGWRRHHPGEAQVTPAWTNVDAEMIDLTTAATDTPTATDTATDTATAADAASRH